jgi:hypothetical protein
MSEAAEDLKISEFQEDVMRVPEDVDIFLGGGRGGAKSYLMALLAARHIEQYGKKARVLYIRQTYPGLSDFEQLTQDLYGAMFGGKASYNSSAHCWKFPNGGYMELGQLEGPKDYGKYQGRSFTLLLVDEAGQYASPELLDRLRSNLRGPKDVPIRTVMAANPGDPGHHWIAQRYVFKAAPWEPFYEEKSRKYWIYAPSTYRDNPFIDQEEYRQQLEAACPYDPELLQAWLDGDWSVMRGAFFGPVLHESRNTVDPWPELPQSKIRKHEYEDDEEFRKRRRQEDRWSFFIAHDYGSSAPSVTYLVAQSPGAYGPDGIYYPKDSLILVDELATSVPGQPNTGLAWTIPKLADAIHDLVGKWGLKRAEGVADDACFAQHGHSAGSIANEFRRFKVYFKEAKKGSRQAGWEIMRRLLADAGKPDVPGLYISRNCSYFWETVPALGRDPRKAEDLDTRQPDHAADAVRYACMRHKQIVQSYQVHLYG